MVTPSLPASAPPRTPDEIDGIGLHGDLGVDAGSGQRASLEGRELADDPEGDVHPGGTGRRLDRVDDSHVLDGGAMDDRRRREARGRRSDVLDPVKANVAFVWRRAGSALSRDRQDDRRSQAARRRPRRPRRRSLPRDSFDCTSRVAVCASAPSIPL